jgi:hypothetical protein
LVGVLPWVHRVFANLKVWALGVYHSLRRQHLQSYPLPSRHRRRPRTPQLQNVDLTGSKAISL